MNKRTILINHISLIFICIACNQLKGSVEAENKGQRPNIIFIFADDMGYGDISNLNPEARTFTPHLDKLAQKSIVFSNAHASASVCTPSRYGLLTGRYAWRSEAGPGVVNGFGKPVIEKGRKTIANLFQSAGYTTACIGKWHLGLNWQSKDGDKATYDRITGFSNVDYSKEVSYGPNDYGFDYSFIHPASLDMPPYVFLRNHQTIDPDVILTSDIYPDSLNSTENSWDKKHTKEHDVFWGKGVWWRRGEISRSFRIENCLPEIVDDGISFIDKHITEKPAEPFFLYLPLTGPHTPWVPTDQFKGKSSIETYGDFIMNIDHVVGRVTETLRRFGIDDNTMIIFSSDNGAYWPKAEIELQGHDSNWSTRGQKGDVWDGGHRIPLIISWPEQIKEQVFYDHLVSLTDLFATFSDLTGQEFQKTSGEDSFSFLHALQGNTNKITRQSMIHQSPGGIYGIRMEEGWKYINGLGSGGFTSPKRMKPVPGGPTGQLYQIKNDPLESVNLFVQHPEIVKKLQKELNEQIEKVKVVSKK
jgi:arylsulfatase A